MNRRAGDNRLSLLGVAAWIAVAVALFLAFFVAREADASMGGQLQRIFYFHVSAAWIAYLCFALVFAGSIAYLRTRSRTWDLLAHSAAEVGVVFCTILLVTGPIWARPVWGTWWQWDARLTSALVLWLVYTGYLLLRSLAADPARAGRPAAIIGIVGFIDVPIVHFSVRWWRTLHPTGPTLANPEASSGLGAPEITTFLVTVVAFTLLALWMVAVRMRIGHLSDEVASRELGLAPA